MEAAGLTGAPKVPDAIMRPIIDPLLAGAILPAKMDASSQGLSFVPRPPVARQKMPEKIFVALCAAFQEGREAGGNKRVSDAVMILSVNHILEQLLRDTNA
jgi:hypothetical protein